MENLDELKQYEIAGKALQEMLDYHTEKNEVKPSVKTKTEPKQSDLGKTAMKILGEALLKEMGPCGPMDRDPYEDCPPKVKKVERLIRFIDRLLIQYKELFLKPYDGDEHEISDELKQLLASSLKVVLGTAITKLQVIWEEKEEKDREDHSADPTEGEVEVEIIPQDTVQSPAGDTYFVKEHIDNKVLLVKKSTNEQFNVSVETFKKWKSN